MNASEVIRLCWVIWAVAILICVGAVGVTITLASAEPAGAPGAVPYVVFGVAYAVLIPLGGFLHWRFFRLYWENGVVRPRGYLMAFVSLSSGFTLSVVMIGVVSVVRRSYLPEILLMMPPSLLLMWLWPMGWAMADRVGSLGEEAAVEEAELFHVDSHE